MTEEPGYGNVMRRRRRDLTSSEQDDLATRWRDVLRSYERARNGSRHKDTDYPRYERLFEIVQKDGRIRFVLAYGRENPMPDLSDYGQRRQVESLLGFEKPLEDLMSKAESRWQAGDFEGEAALLEEFAESNPQQDAIRDLAAEARRDAVARASSKHLRRK